MLESRKQLGFTLIELLLVIAIIGVITTFAMTGNRHQKGLQRDVTRVSNATTLQKALALYLADKNRYPVYTGCIDGSDPVTTALVDSDLIGPTARLFDPVSPSDITLCYYYEGVSGAYTLRYTLEKDSSSGTQGNHIIVP